jgi:hypothetical protein
MAPSRRSGESDEAGIAAPVGGMLAHVGDGSLDVDDLRRPPVPRGEAIVGGTATNPQRARCSSSGLPC